MKNLKWFKQRIGNIIYRDSDGCDCPTCKRILQEGLVIADEYHAQYVFETQNELANDGIILNYRDEK